MTGKQEDKLSMWTAVDAILIKYKNTWSQLKAFKHAAEKFHALKAEIEPNVGVQLVATKGIAENKTESRRKLTTIAAQMAMNIVAYAMESNDFSLEKQFTYTSSYFDKVRDNLLPVIVNTIVAKAAELSATLQPYGVTTQSIQELTAALDQYNNENALPRLATGKRKTATTDLSTQFAGGTRQLKIMTNLLGNFNEKNPEFVAAFNNARIIIKTGSRTKKNPPTKDSL